MVITREKEYRREAAQVTDDFSVKQAALLNGRSTERETKETSHGGHGGFLEVI
jgi:hypothetical protein